MADEELLEIRSTADAEEAEGATPMPNPRQSADEELVLEDLLVEDVSIDGMCGVY